MKRSTKRILTTHTGSLPRPDDLIPLLYDQAAGAEGVMRASDRPLLLGGAADARMAYRTVQAILDRAVVAARMRLGGEALSTPAITAADVRQTALGRGEEPRWDG